MSEKRTTEPIARHGQLRSPGPWSQLLKVIGVAVSVALVSAASVAAVSIYDMTHNFIDSGIELPGQKDLPPDIAQIEGGFNVLLIGLDQCEAKYAKHFGNRCKGSYANAGALNDVNILVHVSDSPRRITAISFPRDLAVTLPACTTEKGVQHGVWTGAPLNAAYAHGGLACAAQTITNLTGQDVHFAASVTFGGVIEITNAMGGVEVCLDKGIRDRHTGLNMKAGNHTISGVKALQFLRTRYGVGDGSDLGRIGNQQLYMSNLAKKLLSSEILDDAPALLGLARTVLNNVTPSQSLTNPVLVGQLAMVMKDVKIEDIVFAQYPSTYGSKYKGRVDPNLSDAKKMWDAINANRQLVITNEPGAYDGVVNKGQDDVILEEDAYKLPSSIRGTSAATNACSNGNVR